MYRAGPCDLIKNIDDTPSSFTELPTGNFLVTVNKITYLVTPEGTVLKGLNCVGSVGVRGNQVSIGNQLFSLPHLDYLKEVDPFESGVDIGDYYIAPKLELFVKPSAFEEIKLESSQLLQDQVSGAKGTLQVGYVKTNGRGLRQGPGIPIIDSFVVTQKSFTQMKGLLNFIRIYYEYSLLEAYQLLQDNNFDFKIETAEATECDSMRVVATGLNDFVFWKSNMFQYQRVINGSPHLMGSIYSPFQYVQFEVIKMRIYALTIDNSIHIFDLVTYSKVGQHDLKIPISSYQLFTHQDSLLLFSSQYSIVFSMDTANKRVQCISSVANVYPVSSGFIGISSKGQVLAYTLPVKA